MGYLLLFFTETASPATVYLISGREDVDAHDAWIGSDPNQELLRGAKPLLSVKEFFHLDLDFETLPRGVERMIWEVSPRGEAEAERGIAISHSARSGSVMWETAGLVLEGRMCIHRLRGCEAGQEDGMIQRGEGAGAKELRRMHAHDSV